MRLQVRALAFLAATRLLLRRRGTTATLQRLGSTRRRTHSVAPEAALRAVQRAQLVVGGECLPQAVALTALLERAGSEPVLVLGCHRRPDGGWDAHAWTRVDHLVLDPEPSGDYAELAWCRARDAWVPAAPAPGR